MTDTPLLRTGTREVILAEGPEGLDYLHGQVSQSVADMAVGESRWSFLLDPRGKVESHLRIHRLADEVCVLDVDPAAVELTLTSLERFKLRTKVTFTRPGWSSLSVRGEGAEAVDIDAVVDHRDVLGSWTGRDLLGPDVALPDGVAETDETTWEAARIAAGVPVVGADLDERTIPQESGLVPISVSFTKGCYRGQELVERIDARGAVRRRLRRLTLAGPATAGDELRTGDDTVVGSLTSVGVSSDGTVVALGVVRDDAEGSTLTTQGAVTVTIGGAVGSE